MKTPLLSGPLSKEFDAHMQDIGEVLRKRMDNEVKFNSFTLKFLE